MPLASQCYIFPLQAIAEADYVFQVPLHGFVESYNVSVAAAMSLHQLIASRRQQLEAVRQISLMLETYVLL